MANKCLDESDILKEINQLNLSDEDDDNLSIDDIDDSGEDILYSSQNEGPIFLKTG